MSSLPGCHKRKEADHQFVFQHSHKKLRQENGLPTIYEEKPINYMPVTETEDLDLPPVQVTEIELPPVQITELPSSFPEQLAPSIADEKAIVLYKPVNPPLFPGGPVAGSNDLPIRVNARFFGGSKGVPGFSNFLFPSRHTHQLPILSSSNASLPIVSSMSEQTEKSSACPSNNLAMVPWVQSEATLPFGLEFSSANCSAMDADQMRIDDGGDSEAMEEDSVINNSVPVRNPTFGINAEPWQHFGVPQPSYTPVMWSH